MGYEIIHEDQNFNFQLNRLLSYGEEACDRQVVMRVGHSVTDFDTWFDAWHKEAIHAYQNKQYLHSMYYYRMAEFFLLDENPQKDDMYNKMLEMFELANTDAERIEIPFKETYLPCLIMKAKNEKKIVLMHGGYDSFIEEFYLMSKAFIEKGVTVILFEGEGQGGTLRRGLKFHYKWEDSVSCILDYFKIEKCALIGISWGGYFALRAAAMDKRIAEVVAYDVMYDGLDVQFSLYKGFSSILIKTLFYLRMGKAINYLVKKKMETSYLAKWAIEHGLYITGTKEPYEFYQSIKKHSLKGLLKKIDQRVLLLAGEKDHYIPLKQYHILCEGLTEADVENKLFTVAEGGEQHCQVGNYQLAINKIMKWLME